MQGIDAREKCSYRHIHMSHRMYPDPNPNPNPNSTSHPMSHVHICRWHETVITQTKYRISPSTYHYYSKYLNAGDLTVFDDYYANSNLP